MQLCSKICYPFAQPQDVTQQVRVQFSTFLAENQLETFRSFGQNTQIWSNE